MIEKKKKWYKSKTLWANTMAILGGLFAPETGAIQVDPETQLAGLGILNIILRFVTNKELVS